MEGLRAMLLDSPLQSGPATILWAALQRIAADGGTAG